MKYLAAVGVLIATTVAAIAAEPTAVPEIDSLSGVAALGLIGAIGALIWERRRRS